MDLNFGILESENRSQIISREDLTRYVTASRIVTMVHLRVNNRESNPNPHINFITALPAATEDEQEDSRQFLRALAAQVRPVMKVRES